MPFCNQCGHENPAGSRFCARCGEPLTASVDQAPGAPAATTEPVPAGTGTTNPATAGSETTSPASTSPASTSPETTGLISAVEDTIVPGTLSDEDLASIKALRSGSALLVVHDGPQQGSRILLQHETETIGRHPDSDIFLDDITVSRHHATLARASDGSWTVTDGGSLNGTYLRKKMLEGPGELRNGDELQVGKFHFLFYTGTPA